MSRVDATATIRQLQELTAAGFTLHFLADQGVASERTLQRLRGEAPPSVFPYIRDAVAYAHRQLVHTDPADHGIASGPSTVARLTAARNGWTTP